MFKTPKDEAQTQLNLWYISFSDFVSGAYYSECKVTKTKAFANDLNKIKECMELTFEEIKKRIPGTLMINCKKIGNKELFYI